MRSFIIIATLCVAILFALQITYKKYSYAQQLDTLHNEFYAAQTNLLYRLGKSIQEAVKNRDEVGINKSLSDYESVLFAINLPVSMQVVLFDAPQQIIGLQGDLAPDENYYMQLINKPNHLAFSHAYTKSVMPDYAIINYGLGIVDHTGDLIGILEAKIPQIIFQEYFSSRLPNDMLNYSIKCLVAYLLSLGLLITAYIYFAKYRSKYAIEIARLLATIEVTNRYSSDTVAQGNVNIFQLIQDLFAANYVQAQHYNAQLIFPANDGRVIFCNANQKALLHLLSCIVRNMLRQSGKNAKICLQLNVSKDYIDLEFSDNGFYTDLDAEWDEVIEHVDHVHTAYVGNKIIYSLARVVKNNVVSLGQYCQDS